MLKSDQVSNILKLFNADAVLVSSSDSSLSEFTDKDENLLFRITNFSGSNGFGIKGDGFCHIFTDGRYTNQAGKESPNSKIHKMESLSKITESFYKICLSEKIKSFLIPIDTFSFEFLSFVISKLQQNKVKIIFTTSSDLLKDNLKGVNKKRLDKRFCIHEKFRRPTNEIINLIFKTNDVLDQNLKYILISCQNLGSRITGIRDMSTSYSLANKNLILISKDSEFFEIENGIGFVDKIKNIIGKNKIGVDPKKSNFYLLSELKKSFQILPLNFYEIEKIANVKSKNEIEQIKKAHIEDGVAVTKFLFWLENKILSGERISELDASEKLFNFRKRGLTFLCDSFPSISGYGPNGSIIHYNHNKNPLGPSLISKDSFYLIDSGGQYKYGTTDITRTVCFKKPSAEMVSAYTMVLKGHIDLFLKTYSSGAKFSDLDDIARGPLMSKEMNFQHGTGHGVGYCLSVHEGPDAISKFCTRPIYSNIIMSNEPGFYKDNEYGIRIENLMLFEPCNKGDIELKNITFAPIQTKHLAIELLEKKHIDWLNSYHKSIVDNIGMLLTKKEREWIDSFII